MLPYISAFGRVLPTYSVLAVMGVVLGLLLALARCRRFGLSRDDCMYLYVFAALGAVAGAKLFYLATVFPQLLRDLPLLLRANADFMARYVTGGMVFYGGLAGAIAGAVLTARRFGLRLSDFFPVLVPVFPLIHGIGRVGCFCAGCCYGVPVYGPLGVAFTRSLIAPNGIPLLPVQLLEAGAEGALCVLLTICASRGVRTVRLLALYLLAYAPVRFVLEFFRGDALRGAWGALSTSQWLSIAAFAAGAVLMAAPVWRGALHKNSEYSQ